MRKKYNNTYQSKPWLKKKYLDEKLSIYEIAKACQVSPQTILNWLKRFDIPRRSIQEALRIKKPVILEDVRLRAELVFLGYLLEEFAFIARVLKKLKQPKMDKEEQENYLSKVRREQKRRHAADRFRKKAERERLKASLEREAIPVDKTLQDEWDEIQAIVDEPSTGRKS